jgi:hypothetical protein
MKYSAARSIRDIRLVHPTVTSQPHVLAFTILLDAPPSSAAAAARPQLGEMPLSLHQEGNCETTAPTTKKSGSGSAVKTLAAIGKRARGLTIASPAPQPEEPMRKSSTISNISAITSHSTVSSSSTASDSRLSPPVRPPQPQRVEHTYLVSFPTFAEQWEWYALLHSLCPPESKGYRRHRRLDLKILDLQERQPMSASSAVRPDEASSHMGPSVDARSLKSREVTGKGKERARAGWAKRERLCCELYVGLMCGARQADTVVCSTTSCLPGHRGRRPKTARRARSGARL